MTAPASARRTRPQGSASKTEKRASPRRARPPGETPGERQRRLGAIFEDVVTSNREFLNALAKR